MYILKKDHYHHGDLKKEMIQKGIQLLNESGYEGFSLRKVAAMCGVSHSAPYKHFRSKDELLAAIIREVSGSFAAALEEAVQLYPDDMENQIVELGKRYVKFMVENPDYMRFIFINPSQKRINKVHEYGCDTDPYQIFRKSALRYLEWLKANPRDQAVGILTMWSIVHGYSMLLVNNNIDMPGDYLEIADKMLRENLRFK